jgi:hypothetical protein
MRVQQFINVLPDPGRRPAPPVVLDLAPGVLSATQESLRVRSDGRREAICLWAGRPRPDGRALISHLIEPYFESTDIFLTVPPDERKLVAAYLRSERLLMFADIHTHPRRAFLSDLDRARPFSVRDGLYAAVVPVFATGDLREGWRLYEVMNGEWNEVDLGERVHG